MQKVSASDDSNLFRKGFYGRIVTVSELAGRTQIDRPLVVVYIVLVVKIRLF